MATTPSGLTPSGRHLRRDTLMDAYETLELAWRAVEKVSYISIALANTKKRIIYGELGAELFIAAGYLMSVGPEQEARILRKISWEAVIVGLPLKRYPADPKDGYPHLRGIAQDTPNASSFRSAEHKIQKGIIAIAAGRGESAKEVRLQAFGPNGDLLMPSMHLANRRGWRDEEYENRHGVYSDTNKVQRWITEHELSLTVLYVPPPPTKSAKPIPHYFHVNDYFEENMESSSDSGANSNNTMNQELRKMQEQGSLVYYGSSGRSASIKEPPSTDLPNHDYTVGWVFALPKELTAAIAMLDQRHADVADHPNDLNSYSLGSIGEHNIVMTCLPMISSGKRPVSTVITEMVNAFPSIKIQRFFQVKPSKQVWQASKQAELIFLSKQASLNSLRLG
ncbi:hypothetical protein PT974_02422 [Cladobotryum mycophilum]|uniref:Uncharacterized protein n=1 Tax=Cladobotryum mycophilum TaxID=491253 RepID=A0ABR0SZ89_9HYPO